MKTVILSFLFLIINYLLLITNCFAQPVYFWETVPCPVTKNLNFIAPLDNTHIVGNNGTVLKFNGTNWVSLTGYPNVDYYSLYYSFGVVTQHYTVVGSGGTIIATTDNFATWNQEPSGTSNILYSVTATQTLNPVAFKRIAVGAGGVILKSQWISNITWGPWTAVSSPVTQDLKSAFLFGANGWICGNNGTFLKSTDAGETWNQISLGTNQNLNCLYFRTDSIQIGYIVGDFGLLMKTTNGGVNWNPQTAGITINLKSIAGNFISGTSGNIVQSTNNGMSWIPYWLTYQYDLNSVNSTGYIVGNNGTILKRSIQYSYTDRILNANNIGSFFNPSGVFDQNRRTGNLAGFEWPKGSGKTAIFTAGLSIAGKINGQLREAMASYKGELRPGAIINGNPYTNNDFGVYSVKITDSWQTNPDWHNWGYMVPFGAPYIDVNNNGTYEYNIDTPGVKGAAQTIYACLTDAFDSSHTSGEGFGGGTLPLKTEVHLTAWAYSLFSYTDMQFIKFEVINKNSQPWNNIYFTLVSDPDLGWANDDYIGCDTIRNLGYVYNGTNNDVVYGAAPPAAGFLLLKGARNKYSLPPINLPMTSFGTMICASCSPAPCEIDPNGEAYGAYLMMKGYKKDSARWMDVSVIPPKKTFFIYSGDPETNTGWTEPKGHMNNCGLDTAGPIIPYNAPFDRRLFMSSGAENLTVAPGDTQTIIISQLIARGTSNLNSVTKLKQLADFVRQFYDSGFVIGVNNFANEIPGTYKLEQNYPNPFNPVTKIRFSIPPLSPPLVKVGSGVITLKVFDITGREIVTLVNGELQPGTYEVTFGGSNYASGVYFYRLTVGDFIGTKKMLMIK
jgi:hypothetical protein